MDEVDDDARLLARLAARDAADALLVDALGGGRREVHADRRARRVPALGEQLRVDQHVDLAALVVGEDPRQLALGRLARDRLRLHAEVAERLGDVVGVAHAGGVDDAGHAVEARLVEVGDRQVERQLVEQLGQHLLVELGVDLAAAQRHLGDRAHARARRDAHAAQRRDDAAARGLREVEARGLGREEVGDVAGDQRARGGHADEDRAAPVADRRRGLLAQRGVGLVADDDRVGVGDVAGVAHEPLVGLDRDRAVGRVLVAEQRRRDAVLVAAVAQLAEELVDQVAAVGEDQHAAGARGLHEAERRDRLAGAGGVLEPEALGGVGVLVHLRSGVGDLRVGLVARPPSRAAPRPRARRRPRAARPAAPPRRGGRPAPRRRPRRRRVIVPLRCASASSAVSVPESASTWWAESTVPSTSAGSSWLSRRSSPSSSDHCRRHSTDGRAAPASSSASAASSARRRAAAGRQRDRCVLALEHERLAGERTAARSMASDDGREAAWTAAAVLSAIEGSESSNEGGR